MTAALFQRARRIGKLAVDCRPGNDFIDMQCCDTADQIFQLANIARPAMRLEALDRVCRHLLARQAFTLGLRKEMPDEIGNILAALAQGRQPDRHDIQPEKEIFAECPGRSSAGGRDGSRR